MKRLLKEPKIAPKAYRAALLKKRNEVLSGLGVKFDTLARMGRLAEEDQAQVSHDEFISLHLNSMDYGRLRLINEALDRLSTGDFGICLECEEPIAPKRLAAVPWARYCLDCQDRVNRVGERDLADIRPRAAALTPVVK